MSGQDGKTKSRCGGATPREIDPKNQKDCTIGLAALKIPAYCGTGKFSKPADAEGKAKGEREYAEYAARRADDRRHKQHKQQRRAKMRLDG